MPQYSIWSLKVEHSQSKLVANACSLSKGNIITCLSDKINSYPPDYIVFVLCLSCKKLVFVFRRTCQEQHDHLVSWLSEQPIGSEDSDVISAQEELVQVLEGMEGTFN